MISEARDSKWICNSCGKKFTPEPPNYSCPECQSNLTFPDGFPEKMRLDKIRFEEQEKARAQAIEEKKRTQQSFQCTTELLQKHLVGLGINAEVIDPGNLESVYTHLSDWRDDSLVGCVKIVGRNIDLIDVYVAWDKGAQYHIYYDYRIVTDVGILDNELRCEWLRHKGSGKKHWRGLAIAPEENWLKRSLFGDKTSDNRLSDLLNADTELTDKFEHLLFGLDAPVVDPSRAGYVWIGGLGGLYTDMGFHSNYEHMRQMELVNYGGRMVRVKLRRTFPKLEQFEACDGIAKYILNITEERA